ncbi:MAG: DTW domain-containing protein [Proteobacteria bacterium]|nr:DTW domain-containing protein [Pseudomonadota bacterium]
MHKIPVPVLILQHPQEPSRKDAEVSSARIITETIEPSFMRTGLSWKNLAHAIKGWKEIEALPELHKPALWHTLYLGTKKNAQVDHASEPGIYYLDKKGEPVDAPENPELGGLILLDGTWAQAKTLWWRNAWLTKTKRIYIVPRSKSLYGNLRKEPRPECVSTVEALAETLDFLGVDGEAGATLKKKFGVALDSFKKRA